MRTRACRWFCLAGLLMLSIPFFGQARMDRPSSSEPTAEPVHLGYPLDWSSRHLLMPGARTEEIMAAAKHDPRYVYSLVMRQIALQNGRWGIPEFGFPGSRIPAPLPKHKMKIDWAVSLENGYVPQNQFPAKYQFGIGAENCNTDYVVMGLTVTSGTQANLVGINNLYTSATTPCNGGSPWVAFAYNTVTQTGGQIKTSPVLSM